MTAAPKHSALPWEVSRTITGITDVVTPVSDDGGKAVCRNVRPGDAEFIVRACNSHYELLEALKALCGKDHLGGSLARDAHIAIPSRECWRETNEKFYAAILKAEQAIARAEEGQ